MRCWRSCDDCVPEAAKTVLTRFEFVLGAAATRLLCFFVTERACAPLNTEDRCLDCFWYDLLHGIEEDIKPLFQNREGTRRSHIGCTYHDVNIVGSAPQLK